MEYTHKACFFFFPLHGDDVDSTELATVFGVGFGLERDLLPFLQRAEAFRLNCGEMHEDVVSPLIVGNETVALSVVEPFYSSVHNITSYVSDKAYVNSSHLPIPFNIIATSPRLVNS